MRKSHFTKTELIVVLFIGTIAIVFVILYPVANKAREKSRRIACASNLKSLGLPIHMYSQNHHGDFMNADNAEDAWEMLRSGGYLEACKIYTCPSSTLRIPEGHRITRSSYAYATGLSETSSIDSGLVQDKSHAMNHKKYGNILFLDGHVSGYSGVNWHHYNGGSIMR